MHDPTEESTITRKRTEVLRHICENQKKIPVIEQGVRDEFPELTAEILRPDKACYKRTLFSPDSTTSGGH